MEMELKMKQQSHCHIVTLSRCCRRVIAGDRSNGVKVVDDGKQNGEKEQQTRQRKSIALLQAN